MFESLKKYVNPYIQTIPKEEVFIGTILFYVVFSLAFFMADHSNIDVSANTIMFFNSWIVFFSVVLYLITCNIFCCVIAIASFLASSLTELILGTLYYPKLMFLSCYLHHILYSIVIICSVVFEFKIFSLAIIGSYIELSAIFQSIKRIWKIKNWMFDMVNAVVFFLTRIVLWIPMVAIVFILSETTGEIVLTNVVASFTITHIFWSYKQIQNLIRRYFSPSIEDELDDLYLTPSTFL